MKKLKRGPNQMQFVLFALFPFIIYIALPCFFLIQMWCNYSTNLGRWIMQSTLVGMYILDIFLTGVWPLTYGYFVRYLFVILFVIVFIKSLFNVEREGFYKLSSFKNILSSVIYVLFIGLFAYRVFFALHGSNYSNPVELAFPLKEGDFYMAHGGTNELINHHCSVSAQKYAVDILRLNYLGFRANKWPPKELDDFCIFGSMIYSPCDGVIVESLDLCDDLQPMVMDSEHPAGNYLAISKSGSEIIVILAHLMKNSLLVKKGDRVEKGQPIAKVGNTGNTSEPHLHIHAVLNHTGDFLFTAAGVPITFDKRFLVRNDRVY